MTKKFFQNKSDDSGNAGYTKRDDVSLHFPDLYNANLSWMNKRMTSSVHHPILNVEFETLGAMISCVADISYFHNIGSSFIATEVIEFGVFEEGGKGQFFMCGDDMTIEDFEEARTVLVGRGGKIISEERPRKRKMPKEAPPKNPKVSYIQTQRNGANEYVVYQAPSKAHALEYLKNNPVHQYHSLGKILEKENAQSSLPLFLH